MMSGKDFLKSHVLSWRRKVYSDWEDVTSTGRAFQVFGPATGKARPPTVDRLTDGTRRRLVLAERSDRLPGRLRIGTLGLHLIMHRTIGLMDYIGPLTLILVR